ncbi:ArsR/SmtB family transcription factor [Halobium salinum]|uniref:ArsR/SmtB family transcription factor n=1 Tax=Halobium salinum TaxID=1364940 RepID=A0ABD5PAH1_9EURY|nr:hypothetical protein [Halobium salinum]
MAESDAPTQDALFGVLANETRLRIVEALGDLSEPGEYSTVPFSELQEAVGVEDNGKFSYHLNKLVDPFVTRTDAGYRLELPGIRVYQALQFWLESDVTVDPLPSGGICDSCGEATLLGYRGGRMHIRCHDCDIEYSTYPLPAAAFDPDDPESLKRAATNRLRRDYAAFRQNHCPYCSGSVSTTVQDGERLSAPLLEDENVAVRHACNRCNWYLHTHAGSVLTVHPRAVSFFYDRGVDIYAVLPSDNVYEQFERVESTDPLRIDVRFCCEGDELRFLVDDSLTVLDSSVGAIPDREPKEKPPEF